MFVWYGNSAGQRFRFFIHSNIYKEVAVNDQMKADVYSQDGEKEKVKFEIVEKDGRKCFIHNDETIYFDEFIYLKAEDFIAELANGPLEESIIYATLERESTRLQFHFENRKYKIVETPHLRKDLGHVIYLTDGRHQIKFYTEEFCLYLNHKDIVPYIAN